MCKQSGELYKFIKKAKLFSFKDGSDFKNSLLKNNLDFPKNGIYLMFEMGEYCNEQKRIVRIGINRDGLLINRLNKASNAIHKQSLNGSGNYIIVGSEVAKVMDEVLDSSRKKRKEREKKLKRILGSQK
jgi:hypothetical protein